MSQKSISASEDYVGHTQENYTRFWFTTLIDHYWIQSHWILYATEFNNQPRITPQFIPDCHNTAS